MQSLTYARPASVPDACSLLDEYAGEAAVLAGGQSLLPLLRLGAASTDCVIDINFIEGGDRIASDGEHVEIGFLARHADVAAADVVRDRCLVLAETAGHIGDRQVRNRGTLCGAVANADPAGDPPVLATLLDAEIEATSVDGTTTYRGESFYHGFYETELAANELVTAVRFPAVSPPHGAAYEKWEPSEGAYPVATVGALVELDGDVVAEAGVVTGALEAGPTPAPAAVEALVDREPTEAVVTEAAEAAGETADPIADAEGSVTFKRELLKTLTKRALLSAVARAGGPTP